MESQLPSPDDPWLERLRAAQSCADRPQDPGAQVVFARGRGATLWTVDGESWIDLTSGYSATNFGHAYPPLIQVAQEQLEQLSHLTGDPHVGRIRLAESLLERFQHHASDITSNIYRSLSHREHGPTDHKIVFNATGARAVESAWKALQAHRPGKLLVLEPGFHGRSIATSQLSTTARSTLASSLAPQVVTQPIESSFLRGGATSMAPRDSHFLRYIIENHQSLCGVLVDPALSARGYLLPKPAFLRELRKLTGELKVPLVADEIQCGLGRCAPFSLCLEQGWEPDMLLLGKSLGGGICPISAVVGSATLLDAIPAGSESETFAATPLACAIAQEVLSQLSDSTLWKAGWESVDRLAARLTQVLVPAAGLKTKSGANLQVDCRVDAFAGVCVVEFGVSSQAMAFSKACARERLRVQSTGQQQTRIVLMPPLTINPSELAQADAGFVRAAQSILGTTSSTLERI